MRFFYFSVFSMALLAAYCVVVTPLIWLIWTKLFNRKFTARFATISALVVAVLPWTEEFWIAYNFGQRCRKDAGIFVNKTVDVKGFYDDTTAWGPRQIAAYGYEYVESRDPVYQTLTRVERASEKERDEALEWYKNSNPGKSERSADQYIVRPTKGKGYVAVAPNRVDAWRVTTLDHPTAQYEYKTLDSHTPVAHQITRFENV
ncbi:MAG TPA: hypothetical protein VMI15_00260, partial [Burkholderiales bacterium]|nr:hypothetical protein [Burkholderiales bacterium]